MHLYIDLYQFQIPIRRPIFIVSLPRSGTTLLSRLMGRDPALHAPVLRDMMHPYRMWAEDPDNSVYKQSQLAFGKAFINFTFGEFVGKT